MPDERLILAFTYSVPPNFQLVLWTLAAAISLVLVVALLFRWSPGGRQTIHPLLRVSLAAALSVVFLGLPGLILVAIAGTSWAVVRTLQR